MKLFDLQQQSFISHLQLIANNKFQVYVFTSLGLGGIKLHIQKSEVHFQKYLTFTIVIAQFYINIQVM